MCKYTKRSWKIILALAIAINVIALSGCNLSGAASASTASTTASETTADTSSSNSIPDKPSGDAPDNGALKGGSKPSGSDKATIVGTATYELAGGTASKESEDIASTEQNKSAVKVSSGGKLTLNNVTMVTKGETESEDESNFYGLNAGVLAEAGSSININKSSITTSGSGANAVFATGTNANITLTDVTIDTTGDSARGLDATYKGTVMATDCTINTKGTHCAAIATDRGEGTINVIGGTMNTAGVDSPAIYSTGNISVTGATLKATGSEAAVVEGKNSITLTGANITGSKKNGVMLYQSASGDASDGTSSFNMVSGSLTSSEGALFFITNTNSVVNLNSVKITNATDTLISSAADKWGKEGENGGNVVFTASSQALSGNIICDNVSTVNFTLNNASAYTGTINGNCAGKEVTVTIDANSTWNVTGDSYITAFTDSLTGLNNIKDNGHNIYYDSSNAADKWLDGKTITLSGGGKLTPDKSKGSIT